MANRFVRRVHPLLLALVMGAAALIGPTLAAATPATPANPPTIASVHQRLGQLAQKNSQLVERYDRSRILVAHRVQAAQRAQQVADEATASFHAARDAMSRSIVAQYEGGTLSAAGALLDSGNGQTYLDQLETVTMLNIHNTEAVQNLTKAQAAATVASTRSDHLLALAEATRNALAKQRTTVEAQIARYKRLLATLTLAQQQAYQRAVNPTVSAAVVTVAQQQLAVPQQSNAAAPTAVPAPTDAARVAVNFALAQVGKPYVWGAAGPSTYDCSGLTMASYAAAGISLPHSAAAQYGYGRHVSINELLPGDLVFLYQPIGHVEIYIGNGLVVSAPTAGQNVSVVPLATYAGDFTGATRLS